MIVAMASIAAVAMTQSLQLGTHRTANVMEADQRFLYTLGSEAWARGQLIRDILDRHGYDGLDEDWAKELPMTPVEGGMVAAHIDDLQGRFNLNNLFLPLRPKAQQLARNQRQLALFRRLLALLELDEGIAGATADWLDQDINPHFPEGAEDNEYLGQTPPYRSANGMLADITELRLIHGVTQEAFDKLAPYVTALPEFTQVNVNTASKLLLRALHGRIDAAAAESLASDREENPFKDKKAFLDRLAALLGDNNPPAAKIEPLIAVSSHYFQLQTQVQMNRVNQTLTSLLDKQPQGVRVLSRTLGNF